MKFKVGDLIKIRKDLIEDTIYTVDTDKTHLCISANNRVIQNAGKIFEIEGIYKDACYIICIDNVKILFIDKMVEEPTMHEKCFYYEAALVKGYENGFIPCGLCPKLSPSDLYSKHMVTGTCIRAKLLEEGFEGGLHHPLVPARCNGKSYSDFIYLYNTNMKQKLEAKEKALNIKEAALKDKEASLIKQMMLLEKRKIELGYKALFLEAKEELLEDKKVIPKGCPICYLDYYKPKPAEDFKVDKLKFDPLFYYNGQIANPQFVVSCSFQKEVSSSEYKIVEVEHLDYNLEKKSKPYYFKTKDAVLPGEIVYCDTCNGLAVCKIKKVFYINTDEFIINGECIKLDKIKECRKSLEVK